MNLPLRPPLARLLPLLMLATVALVACGGGSVSTPTPTPKPTQGPVATPEEAVAAVVAVEPRLTGIMPLDPDLIGQASWYEVVPASGVGAFLVTVRVGWGDCPAGCISEHTWVYAVGPDGTVTVQSDGGDPVPPDVWPSPGGDGRTGLLIVATAGPVCPVETVPPDPGCAPRPVPGATVVVRDVAGDQVATVVLDDSGVLFVELPAGGYAVEAQPVDGLLGTPGSLKVTVAEGGATSAQLAYDTGIR